MRVHAYLTCYSEPKALILEFDILGASLYLAQPPRGDGSWAKKQPNKKPLWYPAHEKTQPKLDASNASGWYGRLRGPISPLSVINSDQLSQQSFEVLHFFH